MRPPNPHVEIAAVNPRRGAFVLAMVLVACVLVLSAQARARGGGTVLQSWILTATSPVANAVSAISQGASGAVSSVEETFTARTENERLRRELAARERELFLLRAESRQNAEERRLEAEGAGLPGVVGAVPVLLLERRAGIYSALIGSGTSEGLEPGTPLAVPAGLVGRVVAVGHGVSRAQLLLDASAAAGARLTRTGELGVVRGDGRGAMLLNNIATTSSVAAGDLVESAGIDGIYPRGVPIGIVESVSRGSKMFLQIRVTPSADFARLTDVLLLEPSPAARENPEVGKGATR